ncbi:MAG TPA: restriction endonuclease [Thermoanaerobaculia bacterium]
MKLPKDEFVGREKEIARLSEWLKSPAPKPILISGVGGIGKSALLGELVRRHPRPELVVGLNLSMTANPEDAARRLIDGVVESATVPEIIVLDAVDQLAGGALPPFLAEIRRILPRTPIVLTSRESMALDAAELALGPLSAEESVELLGRLGLDREDPDLSRLAAELGNHPLALTIASQLAKTTPTPKLIAMLRQRLYELERDAESQAPLVKAVRPEIVIATDRLIEHLGRQPADLFKLAPRKFEEVIAELLAGMGWEVHLTQQTRDGGRDILAFLNLDVGRLLCLVEAKRYSPDRPVGIELVRNLFGVLSDEQASSALLVTTSYFTPDAREFQRRHVHQISLQEYQDVVAWIRKWRRGK